MNSFYSKEELDRLGFKKIGHSVFISNKTSFYNIEMISIGDNVRIDDFCILSGKIELGSNIHISAYCALYGSLGIEMLDYTGLSPRCTVFSATDDFSGDYLIGPMVDSKFTSVSGGKVLINRYSQIGAGSIILPNVIIGEGTTVGAMSLINKSLESWCIYAGVPAKKIKNRNRGLLNFLNL